MLHALAIGEVYDVLVAKLKEKLSAHASRLTMRMLFKTEQHRAEQLRLPFAAGLNLAHNRLQELIPQPN